jgi:lysophospholipase L1-like esterase
LLWLWLGWDAKLEWKRGGEFEFAAEWEEFGAMIVRRYSRMTSSLLRRADAEKRSSILERIIVMKRVVLIVGIWAVAGLMLAGGALAQVPATQAAAPGGRGGFRGPIPTGPSAPVPPEVAMLRPSALELTQIRGSWGKFVENDTSDTAGLLKKYQGVVTVEGPRLNVAATYTMTAVRAPRHAGFVETAKKGDIDLLLHGDSITDWWTQGAANKKMFDKYFGNIKTANFAVAADTTQGLLWGLKNGEGQGFSPKAIMLMIGTNNMALNTAPEVAEGVGAVVLELRKDFPDAKILLLAIFPRSTPGDPIRDKIAETNKIISKLDDEQHVFYMDIGAKFLDENGVFLPDAFRSDNLHPQAKGYDIWGAAVKDKLASLMN